MFIPRMPVITSAGKAIVTRSVRVLVASVSGSQGWKNRSPECRQPVALSRQRVQHGGEVVVRVAQEGVQVCSDQRIGNMVAAMRVVNIVPAHEPYSPLTEPRHKGAVGAPTTRNTGGAA